MSLFNIFNVSGSAMSAQAQRLNVTASNLANADSTTSSTGEAYRAIATLIEHGMRAVDGGQACDIVRDRVRDSGAQRDDLGLQHANMQRVINGLLKVELASPMVVDEKTRRQSRKRLQEYKARLGEIEREEHDVGRALVRARRKVEREEGVDSGLWVRRVTG